jgi:hypothetical protein
MDSDKPKEIVEEIARWLEDHAMAAVTEGRHPETLHGTQSKLIADAVRKKFG